MSSKVKCLILDDELPGLTYLKLLCEQLEFVEVERCFDDPVQFLQEHAKLDYDVCLLDINMPGMSGIDVAQLLRTKPVIFISAHPEFAVNAFDLDALDFIKKPVTRERLEKALLKVRISGESAKDYFTWNTNLGKSTLYFSELMHITTSAIDSRDKTVCMQGDSTITLKNITIEKLLEQLPKNQFIRINKSDIIQRRAIQAYTSDDVVLRLKAPGQSNLKLPLGEAYKKDFLNWVK